MQTLKKQMQKMLKNQKGLTLVELLAVIVILGIIAAIAIPAIANIIDNSRKDAHIANAEALVNASRLAIAGENVTGTVTYTATGATGDSDLVTLNYLDAPLSNPDSDGTYSPASVTYNSTDQTYTVILGTLFGTSGKSIDTIRNEGRESVNRTSN